MKRILVYSPDAGSRPGHSFTYAARICSELERAGFAVRLMTTGNFIQQFKDLNRTLPRFEVLEESNIDFGATLLPSSPWGAIQYLWKRTRSSFRMLRRLSKELRSGDIAIMHWLDNPEAFTTAWFALGARRWRRRRPDIKWFINVHPADFRAPLGSRGLLRTLYKRVSRIVLRLLISHGPVDGFFVHGEWIRDQLFADLGDRRLQNKILVAPYGIEQTPATLPGREAARRQLGISSDAFVVLAFGIIRPDKGVDDIISAVALVPGVTLLIAGRPASVSEAAIREWIHTSGVADRIVAVLEYVPDQKIPAYFAAADVAVLAHSQSFTATSGPLHLACSFRTPVIATNVGEIGRFVREHEVGTLFPPGNVDALAEQIRDFQRMPRSEYSAYVARQQSISESLSWERTVARYLQAYGLHT